jgi:hypothetical protein
LDKKTLQFSILITYEYQKSIHRQIWMNKNASYERIIFWKSVFKVLNIYNLPKIKSDLPYACVLMTFQNLNFQYSMLLNEIRNKFWVIRIKNYNGRSFRQTDLLFEEVRLVDNYAHQRQRNSLGNVVLFPNLKVKVNNKIASLIVKCKVIVFFSQQSRFPNWIVHILERLHFIKCN